MRTVLRSLLSVLGVLGIAAAMTSGVPAAALPPGFPSFDGFTAVAAENYFVVPEKGPRTIHFSTPYNVQCFFEAGAEPISAWNGQDLHCMGDLPGTDKPVDGAGPAGECLVATVGPASGGWGPDYGLGTTPYRCNAQFSSGTLLASGQKISYRNVTCGVGADRLLACLDTSSGEHGFVLRPAGSTAF
ncbi:hypothetical protein ABQE69_09505 [Mycolicibacillus trivialis]